MATIMISCMRPSLARRAAVVSSCQLPQPKQQ